MDDRAECESVLHQNRSTHKHGQQLFVRRNEMAVFATFTFIHSPFFCMRKGYSQPLRQFPSQMNQQEQHPLAPQRRNRAVHISLISVNDIFQVLIHIIGFPFSVAPGIVCWHGSLHLQSEDLHFRIGKNGGSDISSVHSYIILGCKIALQLKMLPASRFARAYGCHISYLFLTEERSYILSLRITCCSPFS